MLFLKNYHEPDPDNTCVHTRTCIYIMDMYTYMYTNIDSCLYCILHNISLISLKLSHNLSFVEVLQLKHPIHCSLICLLNVPREPTNTIDLIRLRDYRAIYNVHEHKDSVEFSSYSAQVLQPLHKLLLNQHCFKVHFLLYLTNLPCKHPCIDMWYIYIYIMHVYFIY